MPEQVFIVPAGGGLWTCAADLVRFGLTWASLLPGELAREALRPHAQQGDTRAYVGLGWLLNPAMDLYGQQGTGPSGSTSLVIGQSSDQAGVAMTSRRVPIEPVNVRLLRPVA